MRVYSGINLGIQVLVNLLVFLPPLIFLPLWNDWYDSSKFLISSLLIGLIILLIGIWQTKPAVLKISQSFSVALSFFLITVFVSTLLSTHFLTSLLPKSYLYTYNFFHSFSLVILSFVLICWLQKNRQKKLFNLALYLTTTALLLSIFGLYQAIDHSTTIFTTYRIRGTIGEPNRLAFYLVAVLPVSFALTLYKEKHLKILGMITVLLSGLILVLTFSRGAWLALGAGLIVFLLSQKKSCLRFLKNLKLESSLILLLVGISFFFVSPLGYRASRRLFSLKKDFENQTGSLFLRLNEWQQVGQLFLDQSLSRKLIGLGPNTATFYLMQYRDPDLNEKRAPDERGWRTYLIRNHYLQTLVNTGILGLIVFLTLVGLTLKQFLTSKNSSVLEKGFYASFLIIIFSSIVYYQTVLTSLLFWILLAILWKNCQKKIQPTIKKIISITLIFSGFIILIFTLVYASADFLATHKQYQLATKLMPWQDEYWKNWSLVYSTSAYTTHSESDIQKAIQFGQKALKLNPLEINNLDTIQLAFYRGGVFLDKNYHQTALEIGKQRVILDPARAETFDDLGLVYLDLGQLDQAQENFELALNRDLDYQGSYLHLGEVFKQKGNFQKAEYFYQTAIERFPNYHLARKELEKLKILQETQNNP